MWSKVKSWAKWAWDWVTVLVVTVLGVLSIVFDYLEQLSGVDLTQIMSQRRAAQISFSVAIAKAAVALYNSRKADA